MYQKLNVLVKVCFVKSYLGFLFMFNLVDLRYILFFEIDKLFYDQIVRINLFDFCILKFKYRFLEFKIPGHYKFIILNQAGQGKDEIWFPLRCVDERMVKEPSDLTLMATMRYMCGSGSYTADLRTAQFGLSNFST